MRTIARGDQFQRRLIVFAARLVNVAEQIPRTGEGCRAARLVRSGTAAAAGYSDARGAESRAAFVDKLGLVLDELTETAAWLELLFERGMTGREETAALLAETRELCLQVEVLMLVAQGKAPRHDET
jgi:four helix bundle protein